MRNDCWIQGHFQLPSRPCWVGIAVTDSLVLVLRLKINWLLFSWRTDWGEGGVRPWSTDFKFITAFQVRKNITTKNWVVVGGIDEAWSFLLEDKNKLNECLAIGNNQKRKRLLITICVLVSQYIFWKQFLDVVSYKRDCDQN